MDNGKKQLIPSWIKKKVFISENYNYVKEVLEEFKINTVCVSAVCPNIYECFSRKYVTFMILGNVCTRNCKFCGVKKGKPEKVDEKEGEKIASAVRKLNMKYVVITSVTRDDLPDGGASHYNSVIRKVKETGAFVEVLIPDFKGKIENLKIVMEARPDVISHNVETVPSLYPVIRPKANYKTSLKVIEEVKKNGFITKSGFMLGLGETRKEVFKMMEDLINSGCDYLVVGQYLKPSENAIEVKEFVSPEFFEEIKEIGKKMGFKNVFAGTFYRSSYMAENLLK